MSVSRGTIPDVTIEALSRNFYKETAQYGFGPIDYVRFVNLLLDLSMAKERDQAEREAPPEEGGEVVVRVPTIDARSLPLRGERILVREFDRSRDVPLFERWLADEAGRQFLLSSVTARRLSIREVAESTSSRIGVIALPGGDPIGSVAYFDCDSTHRKAELRKLIGEPSMRGKGFAREASALWIQYGLQALGLRKIYLNTLETNVRNIRLNEELGFRVEGILHDEVCIDGTYHDVLRMGLWRE
jgi:RimJ/RimL family protein N-acetyltransferase